MACTRRDAAPIAPHEPARPEATNAAPKKGVAANVHGDRAIVEDPDASQTELGEVWRRNFDATVGHAKIGDTEFNTSREFQTSVSLMQRSLLRLLEVDPAGEGTQEALAKYRNAVLSDCQDDADKCGVLKLLASEPNTTALLLKIASAEKDVVTYYRILQMAVEVQNRSLNNGIAELYLARAVEMNSALKERPELAKSRLGTQHRELLVLIMQLAKADRIKLKEADWMAVLKPWNIRLGMEHPLDEAAPDLFRMAVRGQLFKDGKPSPEFLKAVKEEQESEAQSYVKVQGQVSHKVLKNFAIEPITTLDEYFFIVDQLYRGSSRAEDMLLVWDASQKNWPRLKQVTKDYVRIRMLKIITDTNKIWHDALSDRSFPITGLIQRAFDRAGFVTSEWIRFFDRANNVGRIVARIARERNAEQKEVDEVRDFFSRLEQTARVASSQVHMLFIGYYAIKENFSTYFSYMGRNFKVDASSIIADIFNNKWGAWFEYSTASSRNLLRIELNDVLQMAFLTESFADFGIEPFDLLKAFIVQRVEDRSRLVAQASEAFDMLPLQPDFGIFRHACEAAQGKANQPFAFEVMNKSSVSLSASYLILGGDREQISKPLFNMTPVMGSSDKMVIHNYANAGTFRQYLGIWVLGSSIDSSFEISRLYDRNLLHWAETALIIYRRYLQDSPAPAGLDELEKTVAGFRAARKAYLEKDIQYSRFFQDCYLSIGKKEAEIRSKILQYEKSYYELLHKALQHLHAHPEELQALQEEIRVDLAFPSRERLELEGVYKHKYDFWLRVQTYFKTGLHLKTRVGNIDLPVIDKLFQPYLGPTYVENESMHSPGETFIPFGPLDGFIKQVMIQYTEGHYVGWNDWQPIHPVQVREILGKAMMHYQVRDLGALDERYQVKASDLMDLQTRVINILNLTEAEEQLLPWMNLRSFAITRDNSINFTFTLLDDYRLAPMGVMDFAATILRSDNAGDGYRGSGTDLAEINGGEMPRMPFELANDTDDAVGKQFFTYLKQSDMRIVFDYLYDQRKEEFPYYQGLALEKERLAQEIFDEVEKRDRAQQKVTFHFRLGETIELPLLNDNPRKSLEKKIERFHKQTEGTFRQPAPNK